MNHRKLLAVNLFLFVALLSAPLLATQPGQEEKKQPDKKEFGKKDFPFGGGFGGPKQRLKLIPQFDKDGDGRLNAEERAAAREVAKKGGGGGKGFGFPGGGKGGFGPGSFMTKPLFEALDDDKDAKLSKAEFLAGVKKFFAECDKDKKGAIDEAAIADCLARILPQPGFPGGGKGGPKGFPGGFNPGKNLAGEIVKRADTKKTGKVTLADLTAAAETLFKESDKDKKGAIDEAVVASAISQLMPPPGGGFGGPGGFGKAREPAKPGPKVAPADVKSYPRAGLYDVSVLRTIFIDFDNKKDWEAELADFYHTDVEIPATVTVDGKKYPEVGIHFRGNSSYFGVPAGYKRSLGLSLAYANDEQRLYGYKSINLLNSNGDPTFMHSVLFCNLARDYMPAPKANFVKVVINGESWGIYSNQQQFNKEFLKENYKTAKGARWKVPGHPGASAGLNYIGDNIQDYKRHYEIKTKDDEKDWKALVELCKVLDKTPIDKLEAALRPILDIDEVLWFLAIDNATINDDGYWTRASDYELFRDPKGKFHIIAHDTNETFQPMGFGGGFGKGPKDGGKGPKDGKDGKDGGKGPKDGKDGKDGGKGPKDGKDGGGFGKGPKGGGGSYALDPLSGMENSRMPLRSRLLQVPSLRAKYLKNVQTISNDWLDWKKLKPVVEGYRTLIEKEVELDTHKLSSLAEFKAALSDTPAEGPGNRFSLRAFADGRRSYLQNHPELKKLADAK